MGELTMGEWTSRLREKGTIEWLSLVVAIIGLISATKVGIATLWGLISVALAALFAALFGYERWQLWREKHPIDGILCERLDALRGRRGCDAVFKETMC
jgi:hypothetical protein